MVSQSPKVHVRDLLWLVLVVCVGLGWWTERTRLISDRNEQIVHRQKLERQFAALAQYVAASRSICADLQTTLEHVHHHEKPGEPSVIDQLHAVMEHADQLLRSQKRISEHVEVVNSRAGLSSTTK